MKKIRILLAVLSLSVALPVFAADNKIATVDLRNLFDGYWKRQKADAQLKDEEAELNVELKKMQEDFKKSEETYGSTVKSAADKAVSEEEREKRKKQAEDQLGRLEEKQAVIQSFKRTANARMMERQRRMRDELVREIREVITTKSKAGGYTHVLDTAAESINNTPFLLYSIPGDDLTEATLKELNANAPADFLEQQKEDKKKKEELKKEEPKKDEPKK